MLRFVLFAAFVASVATALRLEDVEEGSCRGARIKPVPPGENNLYLNNLKYIPAGSRHKLYLVASGHPRFAVMRERELVDNMCLVHNATLDSRRASTFGFGGRLLGTYEFAPRRGQPSVFDMSALPPNGVGPPLITGTHTITLTDYKTFVFFFNCITIDAEYKSWEVISLTPNLSASTRRLIENHAASLGFKRENFLFLNNENCGDHNNAPHDDGHLNYEHGRRSNKRNNNGLKGELGSSIGGRTDSTQSGWGK